MKHHETPFDATISALDAETSALDVETSAFGAVTSAIARRLFDATTSALGAETSAIVRSYRRYRRGVSGDIGDCGVGITPQMCNRVTNHGDMSTFSTGTSPQKSISARREQVPFSMAIGNGELMHECFPKHPRMGTAR